MATIFNQPRITYWRPDCASKLDYIDANSVYEILPEEQATMLSLIEERNQLLARLEELNKLLDIGPEEDF